MQMNTENTKNPLIDIIVPVYNTAEYLDHCIASITGQTLDDWHLILVDDGSTDSSPEICDRWAEKDSRITVVHKANSGQADSRNTAIKLCTAEYIGFVDSDDWIEPDMYEFLIKTMERNEADIAVCQHFTDYTDRSVCRNAGDTTEVIDHDTAHRLIIRDRIQSYIWQMVFRRSCLSSQMPGHVCYEDYAVLPKWFDNVRRVVRSQRPLYHYRMRVSSVVHTVTPEQEYAFLQAEEQRYRFYKGTPFERNANLQMTIRCIRVAKYITRMDISRNEIHDYLQRIRQRLCNIDTRCAKLLSRKDRLLRYLLIKHTNMFIAYQKTEKRIMANKHADKSKFFK